ncbi:unnamed protein product [Clavelina lepadiformis]|uniref:Conotoxin n=1 Tax=Clavelina lepadiformis TaxID=159417 RepID=A0ABP0GW38_CLALP
MSKFLLIAGILLLVTCATFSDPVRLHQSDDENGIMESLNQLRRWQRDVEEGEFKGVVKRFTCCDRPPFSPECCSG